MTSLILFSDDTTTPTRVPRQSRIRANRLLQVVPGMWNGHPEPTDLGGWDEPTLRTICRAIKSDGYTHVSHGPILERGSHVESWWPRYDLLDQPERFKAICQIVASEGLWNVAMIGLEDSPRAMAKYGRGGFVAKTAALIPAIAPYCSHVYLGVELTEWAGKFVGVGKDHPLAYKAAHEIGEAIYHASSRIMKLGAHLNRGSYGPKGDEEAWWLRAKSWCGRLGYQWGTSGVTEGMIRAAIEELVPFLKQFGVEFDAYEYELHDLARSIRLGNIARTYGIGTANG